MAGKPEAPLRVLLTNITLGLRTGTEINIRDIAIGLLRRGHSPVVYTRDPGTVADDLAGAGVVVATDLARVGRPPDVIHGHHHPETMAALLHFPDAPAVFFSHDFRAWHDVPPRFPRLYRYVAVDDTNRDRLLLQHGIPEERVRVLLNAVDLERFRPRGPLPGRPARALVFSNYARAGSYVDEVQAACAASGVALDVVGSGVGAATACPEVLLPKYDLVFAKGRCALEALSTGCAVVLCDNDGMGALVTSGEWPRLRRLNLGLRALCFPVTRERLTAEIARYDASDAAETSRLVRGSASLDLHLDDLLALYREVIGEHRALDRPRRDEEGRAAAAYLAEWTPRLRGGNSWLQAEVDRQQAPSWPLRIASALRGNMGRWTRSPRKTG